MAMCIRRLFVGLLMLSLCFGVSAQQVDVGKTLVDANCDEVGGGGTGGEDCEEVLCGVDNINVNFFNPSATIVCVGDPLSVMCEATGNCCNNREVTPGPPVMVFPNTDTAGEHEFVGQACSDQETFQYIVVGVEFNTDPVVGIGANRTSETPGVPATTFPYRVTATITPKGGSGAVTFHSSDDTKVTVGEVSRTDVGDTTVVVLLITGLVESAAQGDVDIEARLLGVPCETRGATVLKPTAIATPHPQFPLTAIVPQHQIVDATTVPAAHGLPPGMVRLQYAWQTILTVTVNDQFGNVLHPIYGGAPVTEGGLAINQNMTAAGTYSDPVGNVLILGVFPGAPPPAPPTPPVAAFLATTPPAAPAVTIPQNRPVEVEGHSLSPAIINRQVTTSPLNNLQIVWP